MIRRDEAAAYAAELAATALYAAVLQRLNRRYEPDWTWLTVVLGTIISVIPAIALARRDPATSWPDYERRVAAGFCASGLIIIGWQLWQQACRQGRAEGFDLARRLSYGEHDDANAATEVE